MLSNRFKSALGRGPNFPIFVVGTGRSGTHWLGYSLENHPEIRATIEVNPMFKWVTRMAMNPALERTLFWRLALVYRWQLMRSFPKQYLDKSHPSIWIAEKLKDTFPMARFVGIERDPYATVASMMKHKGVAAWHSRWREFPLPNRFLGIDVSEQGVYESYPLAKKCAMRWLAHHKRMLELKEKLGDSLMFISYERFAHCTDQVVGELETFLDLSTPLVRPKVNVESLDKWKTVLSDEQIEQIQGVVGSPPVAGY